MAQLQSVDAARREMLANLSHDLRTPITTLLAHLESLQMDEQPLSDPERREYVAVAMRQGKRVAQLVEQLLEAATRFQPERWLSGEGRPGAQASSAKRVAMPFGAGPRICPGRYLALLEMKLAMATLLRHFEIERVDTPDGQPAAELMVFTMTPVGLSMRLRERG